MSRETDNLITWLCMFTGFILIIVLAGSSIEFQKKCETSCGEERAITPILDFHEVCLCDEGHGRWRKEEVTGG